MEAFDDKARVWADNVRSDVYAPMAELRLELLSMMDDLEPMLEQYVGAVDVSGLHNALDKAQAEFHCVVDELEYERGEDDGA